MISETILIEGSVPSKKNQRQTFYRNGRIINIPSKRYKEWHDNAMIQLKDLPTFRPPYNMTLTFWMKDNRRTDLDNKVASVLDLLQDAGIIEDDNWQNLGQFKAIAKGIDKNYPRVVVELHAEIEPGTYYSN